MEKIQAQTLNDMLISDWPWPLLWWSIFAFMNLDLYFIVRKIIEMYGNSI